MVLMPNTSAKLAEGLSAFDFCVFFFTIICVSLKFRAKLADFFHILPNNPLFFCNFAPCKQFVHDKTNIQQV